MSTDATLFDALITGNARKVMDELFPRVEPQQPMSRCPDLVERPSPTADTGTAGVGDLTPRERAELIELRRQRIAHERFIADLVELLPGDPDRAFDRVIEQHNAIHGR
jgi:hypothetical protein